MPSLCAFIAYNPKTNNEQFISDFREEALSEMADAGFEAYRIDETGKRQKVSWNEVEKPVLATRETLPVITTTLFAKVMEPVIDAIEALEGRQVMPIATLSNRPSSSLHQNVRTAFDEVMALFQKTEE